MLFAVATPARADCTLSSTGASKPAGYFFYNADFKVMEYCDGANWRMMMGGGIADPALSNLTDVDDALAPSDGNLLVYDSASGKWKAGTAGIGVEDDPQVGAVTNAQWCRGDGSAVQCDQAAPTGGDNLGSHTATQNIELDGHWLSGDGGNEGVFVTTDGKVGINSSNPLAAFFVLGQVEAGNWPFNAYFSDNFTPYAQDVGGGIGFGGRADGTTDTWMFGGIRGGKENGTGGDRLGYLSFHTRDGAATQSEKVRITSGGDVGIGVTNPLDRLHVVGGRIRIDNDATDGNGKGCIGFSGSKLQFSDDCTTFSDIGTLTAEADPRVGVTTNAKWCRGTGTAVQCDQNAPVVSEADPKVGTLSNGKWCTSDGTAVNCATNAPVTSESDPQVGATTTNNWCRGDGSAVQCDQPPPTASSVYNAGSSTTINWSNGTTQYTTANCGAFSFSNMADGASYTLIVQGGTSNTCSFSHSGLTFKLPPGHGATTASKQTLYSFTRAGSNVYVTWIKGY